MNKKVISKLNIDADLSLLSCKAREIIKSNIPFKSGKNFSIIYDKNTSVRQYKDEYEIHFWLNADQIVTDAKFLHEFFHCIQQEEGFPTLYSTNFKYKNLAVELSSFVLDLDVGDRLVTNGYKRGLNYKDAIIKSKQLIEYVKSSNNRNVFTDIEDVVGQGGILAFLKYFNSHNKEIEKLINCTKNICPQIYKAYVIMYNGINMYPYNTPNGVYDIYNFILAELNLQDYVAINRVYPVTENPF